MHSVYPSIGPFVQALTVINILQMSLNLYRLLFSYKEQTVFKIICMGFSVHLQRQTNFSDTLRPIGGGEILRGYCNMFILH